MATVARLLVPPLDQEPYPTLGGEVCDWIEANLCHGPGDVLGQPVELTDEERLFLYRAYEVYPRGHDLAGRRRFKRTVHSRRKGSRKTEFASWICIAEVDPTAPVRFDGWRKQGGAWIPVGRSVTDPYVLMVAVTEEQTEDLAYGAARAILERCDLGRDYDVGIERVTHTRAPGILKPVATAPSARDGARTTHSHFDETHLFVSERLKRAHKTMLRNLVKRIIGDPWANETTTMYEPGEGSVAEESHQYAEAVRRGEIRDPSLFFDHREASESHDLTTDKGLRAALREASGDAWAWTDVEAMIALFHDPTADEADFRRYFLNQRVKSSRKWLSLTAWEALRSPRAVEDGCRVILGFDGSYRRDSTAIVGATVEKHPHLFVVAAWEKPLKAPPSWRVPRRDVEEAVFAALERFEVVEFVADPPGWNRELEDWEAAYGDVIVEFDTQRPAKMGPACDDFEQAVKDGELTHDGSELLTRHVGNCAPVERAGRTVVDKPEKDSQEKIDAAVAAIIAHHRARYHAAQADLSPWVL